MRALCGAIIAAGALIGLGLATAFIGLAFHHHRRMRELEHLHRQATGTPATHTPAP